MPTSRNDDLTSKKDLSLLSNRNFSAFTEQDELS